MQNTKAITLPVVASTTDTVIVRACKDTFFKLFPPEHRQIKINGAVVADLGEEVVCDYCNANIFNEPEDEAFLICLFNEDSCKPKVGSSYIPERVHSAICDECKISMLERLNELEGE